MSPKYKVTIQMELDPKMSPEDLAAFDKAVREIASNFQCEYRRSGSGWDTADPDKQQAPAAILSDESEP